jgi:hypothetical protein
MALWICSGVHGCGETYSLHLTSCPRCHNTDFHRDGPMPKISKHGGATDKTLPQPETAGATQAAAPTSKPTRRVVAEHGPELIDMPPGATVHPVTPQAEEGGESSSPGSSSSASTETPPTLSEPSEQHPPKRARMTASRSGKGRTESGSARSTAGEKTAAPSTDKGA